MNKDAFYNYILHPELLDDRTLKELQLLMDEYPFFQTGRLLYLKNLNKPYFILTYQTSLSMWKTPNAQTKLSDGDRLSARACLLSLLQNRSYP